MQCAPVIIPTLYRSRHFIRCVESLRLNKLAERTDLIIGIDFPTSEKYVEGNNAIKDYLNGLSGFRSIVVLTSEVNLGAHGNGKRLREYVHDHYDRYIFTEDDNEFSPNYLEYMNSMLDRFKDDKSVLAVCGFLFPQCKVSNQNGFFKSSFINAWGVGYWREKDFTFKKIGSENYVRQVLFSWENSMRLFHLRAASLNGFMTMLFRNTYYGDMLKTAEMLLEEKYSIFPSVSKVRNWGHDGSGIHSGYIADDVYKRQEIDKSLLWNDDSPELPIVSIAKFFDLGWMLSIGVFLRYAFFRIFKKDILGFHFQKRRI